MTGAEWVAANLPGAEPVSKGDTATLAWQTTALFVKFFPYALQERAAVEAEIASAGLHENIIPTLLLSGVDDGIVLVYPRVSGVALGTAEARARFYALPAAERRAAIRTALAALTAITEQGWVLVDFYEGNLIYDFTLQRLWLFDWDLCQRGGFPLAAERNYGSSRLMSPEEFVQGATIDSRSNVFTVGRLLALVLGDDATADERALIACATAPDPADRFGSIAAVAARFSEFV